MTGLPRQGRIGRPNMTVQAVLAGTPHPHAVSKSIVYPPRQVNAPRQIGEPLRRAPLLAESSCPARCPGRDAAAQQWFFRFSRQICDSAQNRPQAASGQCSGRPPGESCFVRFSIPASAHAAPPALSPFCIFSCAILHAPRKNIHFCGIFIEFPAKIY